VRWVLRPAFGWVWVPGTVWAPAWVAWRWGDGWAGWAALPPDAEWRLGIGLSLDGPLLRLGTSPEPWCFVPARDLLEPHVRHRLLPQRRSASLLASTRDATRYESAGGRPAVRGPDPEAVEEAAGRAVPRSELRDLPAPPSRIERRAAGGEVGVYRPRVEQTPEGRSPRRARPRPPGGPR
jgi:hypothetical protein